MNKVIMITLDERPCNYNFPQAMPSAGYELVMPPRSYMGDKKTPGDCERLGRWLMDNVSGAYSVILSLDALIYGGIVPSRLHNESLNTLKSRSDILLKIRSEYPEVKIFAFQLIMRCPWYSLSDEEPDYYETYGSELHRYGKYTHLERLNMLAPEDEKDFEVVKNKLDKACLADFIGRREKNIEVLLHNLEYVKSGVIDFFIVPQDDSAVYGFTSIDQMRVREYIKANNLQRKVSMYPSADDTGLTMLARAVCAIHNGKPKVYVYYASYKGANVIPSFEDRAIDETIKFQILSAGCERVYSCNECDIFLAVNIGSAMLNQNESGYITAYDIERNLAEYVEQLRYAKGMGKIVAVADVAHCNGGDEELLKLMRDEGLLFGIDAYAGWNTSSNTLGTVICQAVLFYYGRDIKGNTAFLVLRYFEDMGYCGHARGIFTDEVLKPLGLNYFMADGKSGKVAHMVKAELNEYMKNNFFEIYDTVEEIFVEMPWRRMFEVEIHLKMKDIFR